MSKKTRSGRQHARRSKPEDITLYRENLARRAAVLARLADHQLHLGFHASAERLAFEAETLRMAGGSR